MSSLPRTFGLRQVVKDPRRALRWLMEFEHNRKFEAWPGSYRGVFGSFAEARASAPRDKHGFDHPELASIYDDRLDRVFPSDYPVLFWLDRILPDVRSVFDWGGHIGLTFYAYRKYLEFADTLSWRVCDMPAIIEAGAKLAEKKGERGLSFTSNATEADGFDAILAAGSLQYLERPFAEQLAALSRRPRHLLINKLPLYEGEPFVTLQNTVHSYNAYQIGNRAQFVGSVERLGYTLVDSWTTPDVTCIIPLHPERSIHAYSGLYFRAAAS
jgi:putative methyltransferase (TIGR04325 family)